MSANVTGTLSTPDQSTHIVLIRPGFIGIFLAPIQAEQAATVTESEALDWVSAQTAKGTEAVMVVPGLPFPVTITARREAGAASFQAHLNGMADQPWSGLLFILRAIAQGDPSRPAFPTGYLFRPCVGDISKLQAAEC